MKVVRGRRGVGLAVAMGLVWSCFLCNSVWSAAPTVYWLRIDSQSLDGALQDFARQTGMQILFFSRLTDGRHSAVLDGMYTIDTAMTALLSESKLTYRLINAKTIEIVAIPAAPADRKAGRLFRRIDAVNST